MDAEKLRNSAERFWSKVDKTEATGCWPWLGAKDQHGYGNFKVGRQVTKAHRVAFALHSGVWPDALMVCHSCDNPQCCNPDHLWTGTNQDNQIDCVTKGRKPRPTHCDGESNPHAKLNKDQAMQIIDYIASGFNNKRIAEKFGVTHSMVSRIRLGLSWPELPRPADNDNFKRYASLCG